MCVSIAVTGTTAVLYSTYVRYSTSWISAEMGWSISVSNLFEFGRRYDCEGRYSRLEYCLLRRCYYYSSAFLWLEERGWSGNKTSQGRELNSCVATQRVTDSFPSGENNKFRWFIAFRVCLINPGEHLFYGPSSDRSAFLSLQRSFCEPIKKADSLVENLGKATIMVDIRLGYCLR